MPIDDVDAGRLLQKMDSVHSDVARIWEKVEKFDRFQVLTEERMATGVVHFNEIDTSVECVERKVESLEGRECPSFPSPKLTYTLISVGFIILGMILSVK